MNCLNPRIVFKDKFGVLHWTKRTINRVEFHAYLVGCGKCVPCLLAEQRDWALRLQLEAETSDSAWFITLTFDDEHLPSDNCVHKKDVQRFLNSLRKKLQRICYSKNVVEPHLSYFACGEYGRKGNRPHYHIMLYNMPCHQIIEMYNVCAEIWHRGFVKVEPCSETTCNYIAKYMTKCDPRPHDVAPFRLMSLKPALGFTYFETHAEVVEYINRDGVFLMSTKDGKKHRIPRSIRRKYYTYDKREKCLYDCELRPVDYDKYCRDKPWILGKQKNAILLERLMAKFLFE